MSPLEHLKGCGMVPMTALMVSLAAAGPAVAQQSPTGRWEAFDAKTGKVRAVIEVVQNGSLIEAHIVHLVPRLPPGRHLICDRCSDDRKDRPIEGLQIVRRMQPVGEGVWDKGELLDPESGKVYDCRITLQGEGKELAVRGYLRFLSIGRNQIWRRIP